MFLEMSMQKRVVLSNCLLGISSPILNSPALRTPIEEPITTLDYLITTLAVLFVFLIIPLINKWFVSHYTHVEEFVQRRLRVIRINNLEIALPERLLGWVVMLVKYCRSIILLVLVFIGLSVGMVVFPATRGYAVMLAEKISPVMQVVKDEFSLYAPDLLMLVIVFLVARYLLRFLNFLSDGIRGGKIRVSGVHPELIDPTLQLLRVLVIALALVASYSYIPGSDSPVFRAVSLFIGFLLSMGSTSVVANLISGIVLIYTRGLKVGDRVQIGETIGDVIERNLLVTRIRTIKNVVITIPNGAVLNTHIVNYSILADERGVILNTTVTIGYDVPWRQVHQLLIQAALYTYGVREKPSPFVLQTSLDDYYVSYELNAFTNRPSQMAQIYSELHQNIQDGFNQAGVEILSPAYSAWRDGSPTTTPAPRPVLNDLIQAFRPLKPEDTRPIHR